MGTPNRQIKKTISHLHISTDEKANWPGKVESVPAALASTEQPVTPHAVDTAKVLSSVSKASGIASAPASVLPQSHHHPFLPYGNHGFPGQLVTPFHNTHPGSGLFPSPMTPQGTTGMPYYASPYGSPYWMTPYLQDPNFSMGAFNQQYYSPMAAGMGTSAMGMPLVASAMGGPIVTPTMGRPVGTSAMRMPTVEEPLDEDSRANTPTKANPGKSRSTTKRLNDA